MYPYDASRADELTIQPGDVITVLFIDSENWWMGELADGRQGYFPSNYVMEQGEIQETLTNNCKRKASVHIYLSLHLTCFLRLVPIRFVRAYIYELCARKRNQLATMQAQFSPLF